MKYIYAAVLTALIAGCMTTEKATHYLQKNNKLGEICGKEYPPKIEYRPGETITKSDTVTIPGDSVDCPPVIRGIDTVIVRTKCPDNKRYTDTIYRVDTAMVENTAMVDYLNDTLDDRDNEIDRYKQEISRLKKSLYIVSGLFILFVVGVLFRLFLRLKGII